MITSIRRYMQTTSYRYILSIAVISFIAALLIPPVIRKQGGSEWFLDVNNRKITQLAFQRKVVEQQEFLNRFRQAYGSYTDLLLQSIGLSNDPKQLAHQQLVKEALLQDAADNLHIYAHPTSVARELSNMRFIEQQLGYLIPPYAIKENGSIDEYVVKEHLRRIGISLGEFDQLVAKAVERQMVINLVSGANYLPQSDVEQQFIDENLGKKFSILSFSLATFLKDEKNNKLTDQEIQDYFNKENTQFKRYWVAEKRGGILWKFNAQTYGITVNDTEITSYYEDHKNNDYVEQPTQVQVRRILLPVESDENIVTVEKQAMALHHDIVSGMVDFAQKAKELSGKDEGLLPFFARGEKEHVFERAAFMLKNIGDISPIIHTTRGFEILQLVNKKMRVFKSLEKVKEDIKQKITFNKFKTQFVQDMKDLLEKPEQKKLETFIKTKGGKQEIIKPIVQDQSSIAKALFAIDKKGTLNFYIDKEIGHAVQLTNLEESFLPTLDSVKDVVINDIYEARAMKSMHVALENIKKQALDNPSLDLKSYGKGNIEITDWIKKDATEQIKSLDKKGIPTNQILQLEKIGAISVHIGEQNGYVVRLDAIEPFNEELFLSNKDKIEKNLYAQQTNLILEGFVASLYRNATITINESIMNPYQEYSI